MYANAGSSSSDCNDGAHEYSSEKPLCTSGKPLCTSEKPLSYILLLQLMQASNADAHRLSVITGIGVALNVVSALGRHSGEPTTSYISTGTACPRSSCTGPHPRGYVVCHLRCVERCKVSSHLCPGLSLMRRFYLVTRDLHLYIGLFLSPFVLVFSASVFYLVHGMAYRPAPDQAASSHTVNDLVVPPGLAGMQGRARVDALRPVLDQAGVSGEIDFVRHLPE